MSTATSSDTKGGAAADLSRRSHSPTQRLQHLLHAHPSFSPALILVVTLVAFSLVNSRFAEPAALSILVQQMAIIAALAIGQTLVVLTAGIDLSCASIAILSSMVMGTLAAQNHVPGPLALLIGIVLGVAAGALNGLLVTRLSLPPFIVTLGSLSIFTAIALIYSGGQSILGQDMPPILTWTGTYFHIGGFNLTTGVVIVLVMYAVVAFVLTQTTWGRHVFAVGDDPEAARLSGVPSTRILMQVYTVAGLIYGITAWCQIGRATAASPNGITDGNLASITAVVVGGTSLFGGRGGVLGSLLGALIVQSFYTGLSLAGVDQNYRLLAAGALVVLAASIDQWIRKVKS